MGGEVNVYLTPRRTHRVLPGDLLPGDRIDYYGEVERIEIHTYQVDVHFKTLGQPPVRWDRWGREINIYREGGQR
jgi:hypothetical protein